MLENKFISNIARGIDDPKKKSKKRLPGVRQWTQHKNQRVYRKCWRVNM